MARSSAIYTQVVGYPAYRNWAKPISDALNATATRTTDTGQVNWATVTTEPAGGAVRDFEVFAIGGSLQATAPIYLRFDYQGSSTTTGGIYITVGTTTDGAGNLGGLTVAKMQLQAALGGTNQYAWASCDSDSYFTFAYNLDPGGTGNDAVGVVVVERTRTLPGAASGAGFHVWRWTGGATSITTYQGGWSKTFGATSQPQNANYNLDVLAPELFNTNTAYVGGTSYAYPVYTYTAPFAKGASKALLLAFQYDFPRGQPVTLTHYGEPMTFISMSDAVTMPLPTLNNAGAAATKTISPLIRWD
jgi:hypothetical protein